MARIAGIQITKTVSGKIKSVTFDAKKYGEKVNPVLPSVNTSKNLFDEELKHCITSTEMRKRVHAHILSLPWKR